MSKYILYCSGIAESEKSALKEKLTADFSEPAIQVGRLNDIYPFTNVRLMM